MRQPPFLGVFLAIAVLLAQPPVTLALTPPFDASHVAAEPSVLAGGPYIRLLPPSAYFPETAAGSVQAVGYRF
jgi:hypothetical protein